MDKNRFKIDVDLNERSYCIFVGRHILEDLPQYLRTLQVNQQVALISTPPVSNLYRQTILSLFNDDWYVNYYDVPDGEKSKSDEAVRSIYTWLLENQYERNSTMSLPACWPRSIVVSEARLESTTRWVKI
jgi:3-dehydroquinate synthetase